MYRILGTSTPSEIAGNLSLSHQIIQYWVEKAIDPGYNPAIDPHIHLEYIEYGKRSSCPKVITKAIKEGILNSLHKDHKMGVRNHLKF